MKSTHKEKVDHIHYNISVPFDGSNKENFAPWRKQMKLMAEDLEPRQNLILFDEIETEVTNANLDQHVNLSVQPMEKHKPEKAQERRTSNDYRAIPFQQRLVNLDMKEVLSILLKCTSGTLMGRIQTPTEGYKEVAKVFGKLESDYGIADASELRELVVLYLSAGTLSQVFADSLHPSYKHFIQLLRRELWTDTLWAITPQAARAAEAARGEDAYKDFPIPKEILRKRCVKEYNLRVEMWQATKIDQPRSCRSFSLKVTVGLR